MVYLKLDGGDNMDQTVTFDYFYGGQSDAFSFYRIPRILITGQQFKRLSTDAKLLYGLLLDRMGLSFRNEWYDEQGRVYIYYRLDEIQADLNCGHDKAVKLLSELDTDKGIGLIERVRQGQGRPTKICVKQFTTAEILQPPEGSTPRLPKNGSQNFELKPRFLNILIKGRGLSCPLFRKPSDSREVFRLPAAFTSALQGLYTDFAM